MRRSAGCAIASPVAAILARLNPIAVRRLLRYGCVGIAASLLYSLAVITCVQALPQLSPTAASIVAFIVTLPVVYLAHRRISFSDRQYDSHQPMRFAFSTTTSFIVAVGGMYWITEIAGQSYLLGIVWNWLVIPAMNFLAYILWVFRAGPSRSGA